MKFNKKMLIILCSVVAIILFIMVIAIIFVGGSSKVWSYATMEEKIILAGKKYYNDNKEELPEFGTTSVDVSTLVSREYLSDLSEHSEEGVYCSGKLYVTKNIIDYTYRVNLDCGDNYSTTKFNDIVMKNLVTTGDGLYETTQVNPENANENHLVYVFKGQTVNNYIKIGKTYFRIVKVYENGEMAILDNGKMLKTNWDNRYNIVTDDYKGINDYERSIVRDAIQQEIINEQETYQALKTLITTHTACIGNKNLDDDTKDGSTECSKTLKNQYFSMLPAYDFMNASLDDNCNEIMSQACYNYNYLSSENGNWWTITGVGDNNQDVYYVSGSIEETYASSSKKIRLYAHLDANVTYVSGSGTFADPYILK